jgi:two-component system NtrC family sensor kinase
MRIAVNPFKKIHFSIGGKIGMSFLAVVLIGTVISTLVGIRLVGNTVLKQAQNKVKHDLASAWMVYDHKLKEIQRVVSLSSQRFFINGALNSDKYDKAVEELERVRVKYRLDILTLTDNRGTVVVRTRAPYTTGDNRSDDPLVEKALSGREAASTMILDGGRLILEGEGLAQQAYIEFIPTDKAKPRTERFETAGMLLMASSPVIDEQGNILGVLYGGILLNRDFSLVDTIKDLVYRGEKYRSKDIGTATIFQWDLRIATNVLDAGGRRAIGTRVSETVYDRVLLHGSPWIDRAFVVNDWYVSAYEPIRNMEGKILGILYVGMLEQPYVDMRKEIVWMIVRYSFLLSMAVALIISLVLSRRIALPIRKLAQQSEDVANGSFNHEIVSRSRDEIGVLAESFNRMTRKLEQTLTEKDRVNNELREMNVRYLELLGFATHELMQPLGVLKGYLTLMRDCATGALPAEQQLKATPAMLRNVESLVTMSRMYLDLSRIESGAMQVNRIRVHLFNEILAPIINDMESQIAEKEMRLQYSNADLLQRVELEADPSLVRVVFTNLLTNALKYGKTGGRMVCGVEDAGNCFQFNVMNEGQGMPGEKLDEIFGKFVRLQATAHQRKGAGLGLFITREIVEMHGGTIRAESVENEYANFIFTLPKQAPETESSTRDNNKKEGVDQ